MSKNRICILIPTFPPHYKYAHKALKSYKRCHLDTQADLFFVFSNNDEKEAFGDYQNCIILPIALRVFTNGGIINIKKFYGLFQLMKKYDYIIVFDDEVKFIKNVDLLEVCESFYSRKILYGNEIFNTYRNELAKIVIQCQTYFINHPNYEKLSSNLYLWFNQLCIYKTEYLEEFFGVTNVLKNLKHLAYNDFDYYIYMFYLMLYHGFQIENIGIKTLCGCLEENLMHEIIDTNYKNKYIYSCTKHMYKTLKNPRLFVIMHEDRCRPRWVQKISQCVHITFSKAKKVLHCLPTYRVSLRIENLVREIDEKMRVFGALDYNLYMMRLDYERAYWRRNELRRNETDHDNECKLKVFVAGFNMLCKKHDIAYWIYEKSLLALQRGSGLDDANGKMSIGMLREDFETLQHSCDKETGFLISYKYDYDNASREIHLSYCNYEALIYVFDSVLLNGNEATSSSIFMSLQRQKRDMWKKYTYSGKKEKAFSDFLERYRVKAINNINDFTEDNEADWESLVMGLDFNNPKGCGIHMYDEIFPLKKIDFDDQYLYIPHNSFQVISKLYGDFSRIPDLLDERM